MIMPAERTREDGTYLCQVDECPHEGRHLVTWRGVDEAIRVCGSAAHTEEASRHLMRKRTMR